MTTSVFFIFISFFFKFRPSYILIFFCLLQDARRATELEAVMEKQKMKVDLELESGTLWAAGVHSMKSFRWIVFWWCPHLRMKSWFMYYIYQITKMRRWLYLPTLSEDHHSIMVIITKQLNFKTKVLGSKSEILTF